MNTSNNVWQRAYNKEVKPETDYKRRGEKARNPETKRRMDDHLYQRELAAIDKEFS